MTAKTISEVLAEHQTEVRGMSYGAPDACLCGAKTYPERGEEDVTIRRDRAFAAHQAAALSAAGFGLVADAKDRVGKRYAKLHQMLRDELQAQAWDRGMADQLRLLKAGPGYEMGNPYRKRHEPPTITSEV